MKTHTTRKAKEGKTKYRYLLLLSLPLLAVSWVFASAGNDSSESVRPPRILSASSLQPVLEEGLRSPRIAIGRVEARRNSALGFERSGLVKEVLFEEGQQVKEGEVLARLDRKLLQVQARQLDAALAESEAVLELRERNFKRQQELRKQDIVSEQLYDEARLLFAQATAARDRIKAERERVSVDIVKSDIRAPFNGRIAKRHHDEGEVLASGIPVFEILEESGWEFRAGLSPAQASTLAVGQVVPLSRTDSADTLPAQVAQILPTLDDRTRTVDVIFEFQKTDALIREGEIMEFTLEEVLEEQAFALPPSSLQEGPRGTWVVYVARPLTDVDGSASPTHQIEARPVQIVGMAPGQVYVQGLLEPGETILKEGLHKFTPGQRIRLNDEGDAS